MTTVTTPVTPVVIAEPRQLQPSGHALNLSALE